MRRWQAPAPRRALFEVLADCSACSARRRLGSRAAQRPVRPSIDSHAPAQPKRPAGPPLPPAERWRRPGRGRHDARERLRRDRTRRSSFAEHISASTASMHRWQSTRWVRIGSSPSGRRPDVSAAGRGLDIVVVHAAPSDQVRREPESRGCRRACRPLAIQVSIPFPA